MPHAPPACGAFFHPDRPRSACLLTSPHSSFTQLAFPPNITRVCVARISHFSKKAFTSSPAPHKSLNHNAFGVKTLSRLLHLERWNRGGSDEEKCTTFSALLFHLPPRLQSVRLGGRECEDFSAKSFTHNSMMHKKLRNKGEAVKEKNEKQRSGARTRGENAQVFTQNGEEDEKSSRFGEENRHAFLLFRFIPC